MASPKGTAGAVERGSTGGRGGKWGRDGRGGRGRGDRGKHESQNLSDYAPFLHLSNLLI